MKMDDYSLRFPIGEHVTNKKPDEATIAAWIETIENFPAKLQNFVQNMDKLALDYKYRPNGWTVRQVIHHLADSHINSFTRFKLTLTEEKPTIRPYFEDRWANLIDSKQYEVQSSILLLTGLHDRWTQLLKNLSKSDLALTYVHPEHGKEFNLQETVGMYAWHCNHHFAHIQQGVSSNGLYN